MLRRGNNDVTCRSSQQQQPACCTPKHWWTCAWFGPWAAVSKPHHTFLQTTYRQTIHIGMKERRKTMRIIDSPPHPSLQPLLRRTTLPSSSRNVSKITVVLKKSYTRNFLGHKNLRLLLLRLLPFYSIWYIMDFECRTLLLAYALCSSLLPHFPCKICCSRLQFCCFCISNVQIKW